MTDLAQATHAYQGAKATYDEGFARLEELMSKRQSTILTDDEVQETLGLEKRLEWAAPVLQRLQAEMIYASEERDVQALCAQWESVIPRKRQAYEAVARAVEGLQAAIDAVLRLHEAQEVLLEQLPASVRQRVHFAESGPLQLTWSMILPNGKGEALTKVQPLTRADLSTLTEADQGCRALNPRLLEQYFAQRPTPWLNSPNG